MFIECSEIPERCIRYFPEYDPLLNINGMTYALVYQKIGLDKAIRSSCLHTVRMRLDLDQLITMDIHDFDMG